MKRYMLILEERVIDNLFAPDVSLAYDVETGVEYFVVDSDEGGICPRLNADGKPVVYKGKKDK